MPAPQQKVLFTSHTANFSKFNRPFMRMLKEQGYEVHYASAGEEKVYDTDKHFDVPFERSPFKLGNIKAYFKLKKIIDNEQYNLIHTHTPMGSVVTRLAARAARKNGTRVIYTAHGFHFFKGAPFLNWIVYYPIEKYMARYTDTLITINNEDFERASNKFKTDVRYIPGVGIDPKKFDVKMTKIEKKKLRNSLGLKDSDFVIIYVAELSKRKNQLWLLSALNNFLHEHSGVHLVLCGGDSLKGAVHQLTEKLGLIQQVHFLGYRNDIPQLMKTSDLAVSVSLQEGLPVNVMEAMYLGLPVVATDCRGNRDLVESNSNAYLVRIHDRQGFSEGIETYFLNRKSTFRNTLSINNKYTLNAIQDSMIHLYAERLANG
ncbi:MAG: glycosyltransferase family 4 protein [Candidatus Saccharimonadaceae bacterium]